MSDDVSLPAEILEQLDSELKEGRIYSAWKRSLPFGALSSWSPGRARFTASCIAAGVGDERLSRILDWTNWRADRGNPEWYFHALFSRMRWKTPVEILPEIQARLRDWRGSLSDKIHSDLLAIEAWSQGSLRDFDSAHESIRKALDLTPDRSWTHVQHSSILEMEDRYDEALEAARRSLELRHYYRPSVMQTADCLIHLGRDDEAIGLLREAHDRTEQGSFALRLQALYSEREDHVNALWCLEEAERLMPMMSAKLRRWLAGRRADFLYMAGDFEGSLEWSDRKGEGYHQTMATNLRRPGARERKRVRLDVPFVRQHNMTCAPATLAALASYWERDHDHLAIADAICYDGTPWHKERGWAESNDFIAREFRFTRSVLKDLIDRGIPFTLTTTAVTSAHLQACIGYDDRTDLTLLRDPTHRHFGEVFTASLIEDHPVQGPRCMLLLPTGQAHRLEGLHLPDEALYEARHQLACALEAHDRWRAEEAVSTMRAIDPDHPLTIHTESELLGYLGQYVRQLQLIDRLCGRFPDQALLQSQRLRILQRLGEREEADQLLERMVADRGCDPSFVSELGELLLEDSRQMAESGRFLRRALRMQRGVGRPLASLALWQEKAGNHEEACRLRRFASCLSPTWEPYARGFFDSCRIVGRIEEGLAFLKRRTDRLGRFNSEPWLTQAGALDSLRRSEEAMSVLERAVVDFPDDGELRLRAGMMMLRWGEAARTKGLSWIEEARGRVAESYWLRQRAAAAEFMGDRPLAIRLWRSLLALEPTATDACSSLVQLLAEEKGRDEALRFLEEETRRHPKSITLWGLVAQWRPDPGESRSALDRLLELDPNDLWARRERALKRFDLHDSEGALADAREALSRHERDPDSLGVLASLMHRSGNVGEALDLLRKSLAIRIDQPFAIRQLIAWSPGKEERKEAIAFLAAEMRRQVSNGDCVQEFQVQAWQVLDPPELMARLQEFCEERPDLWQTWQARLDQALRMDLLEEARVCADRLTASFPLLPRTWMEEAKVRHAAHDFPGETEALRKAVDLSPAWDIPARKLSEALERTGRLEEAEEVLRQTIRHEPLECINHGLLADLLLKQSKLREAYDQLGRALEVGPFYHWGWMTSARLSVQLGCVEEFLERVHGQGASHGHHARWWTIAAEVLASLDRKEEALDAARQGLALAPDHVELRDQLAETLCGMGRFDEALEVCSPQQGASEVPREIAGRRAWVLMESGNGPAAIKALNELLEKEPDYAWGWSILSGWYTARKDWTNLSRTAAQWTRFCPDQSTAHGHQGLAAENLDDNKLAMRAYERAFLLDPEYQFAGRKLFRLQLENREHDQASKTLSTLRHFTPGPWVECDAISLALARDRDSEALDMGGMLCLSSTNIAPVEWLNREFSRRGLGLRWLHLIERIVKETPTASPILLHAWADQAASSDDQELAARRLRKFQIPEAARNAAWAVLLRAAKEARKIPMLESWIRKERARFSSDAELWNVVGELYLGAGMPEKAIRWLQDWKRRPDDVGSHTLVNLTSALDTVRDPSFASDIRMHGIQRFRGDVNAQSLRAAQAAYLVTINRLDEAAEMLAPVEDDRLSRYYGGVCGLARSVLAASANDESQAALHYRKALEALGIWPADRAVKWYVRHTQKALAARVAWASGRTKSISRKWGSLPVASGASTGFKVLGVAALVVFGGAILIAGLDGKHYPFVLLISAVAIGQIIRSSNSS